MRLRRLCRSRPRTQVDSDKRGASAPCHLPLYMQPSTGILPSAAKKGPRGGEPPCSASPRCLPTSAGASTEMHLTRPHVQRASIIPPKKAPSDVTVRFVLQECPLLFGSTTTWELVRESQSRDGRIETIR